MTRNNPLWAIYHLALSNSYWNQKHNGSLHDFYMFWKYSLEMPDMSDSLKILERNLVKK
jgi:hypothetical protein